MKIVVTGDFCPQQRILPLIVERRYAQIYNDLLPVLAEGELVITNLEGPLVDDDHRPVPKIGRNLRAPSATAEALRYGGFNLVTLANNHIMDFGERGLAQTIDACERARIGWVGAGATSELAARPYFYSGSDTTIAVVNVAEHEFSIASRRRAGANPLDPVRNFETIQMARAHADHVLVIVHGGHEHYSLPSERMVDTYRFFVSAGASAVVGHHTHCYSGYERFRTGCIFYGLGNLSFDHWKRDCKWNYGCAVTLSLRAGEDPEFSITPYVQGNSTPGTVLLSGTARSDFEADIARLNAIISDPEALRTHWDEFVEQRTIWVMRGLLPLNTYLTDLCRKAGLPFPISKQRARRLLNTVRCESHRDSLIAALARLSAAD